MELIISIPKTAIPLMKSRFVILLDVKLLGFINNHLVVPQLIAKNYIDARGQYCVGVRVLGLTVTLFISKVR